MNNKDKILEVLTQATIPLTISELSHYFNSLVKTVTLDCSELVQANKLNVTTRFKDTNGGRQLINYYTIKE